MTRDPKRLGDVVAQLIHYRGWVSAKELDRSYEPDSPPVSYGTIYRIINADPKAALDKGQKLYQLADMLGLPRATLRYVYDGNAGSIEKMELLDGDTEETRHLILDLMDPPAKAVSKRRIAR